MGEEGWMDRRKRMDGWEKKDGWIGERGWMDGRRRMDG